MSQKHLLSVIISPDTYHSTIAPNTDPIVLLLDPEGSDYEFIAFTQQAGCIQELDDSVFHHLRKELLNLFSGTSCKEAWELSQKILHVVSNHIPGKPNINSDMRVKKIIEKRRREPPDHIRIQDLEKDFGFTDGNWCKPYELGMTQQDVDRITCEDIHGWPPGCLY
ncbi:MAG: hypothetical protein HY881_22840 [Deltaproteobacteria bacterium]|nr:hypothetical protein [Deltaproteobacteria bacterium]